MALLLCISEACAAKLPEEAQRLMSIQLEDGSVVSEAMPAYEIEGRWFLPLGDLSSALGIAIDLKGVESAKGFVLDESRIFSLDPSKCEASLSGRRLPYPCQDLERGEDDLFVESHLLEKWLPLGFAFDTFGSVITVQANEKLPTQLRRERARQQIQTSGGIRHPDFVDVPLDHVMVEGPFIDQQLITGSQKVGSSERGFVGEDTLFTGEVAGAEAILHYAGQNDDHRIARLGLARHDEKGQLLGVLGAREVQVADFDFPSINLVSQGDLATGAMVSNFPLNEPRNFFSQDFVGDLPAGWDAELYQNDLLVARQESRGGLYEFRTIPLLYGMNRFRLVFYGPQGQKREKFETYGIDPLVAQPNARYYRLGAGRLRNGTDRDFVEVRQSLSNQLSASVGTLAITPLTLLGQSRYAYAQLNGFARNLNYSTTFIGADDQGSAVDLAAQFPIEHVTLGAGYSVLNHFRSDYYDPAKQPIREIVRANSAFTLPIGNAIRATFELARATWTNDSRHDSVNQRLSTQIGSVYLFNDLAYTVDPDPALLARLDAISLVSEIETRFFTEYGLSRATAVGVDLQGRGSSDYVIGGGVRQDLVLNVTQYQSRVGRIFSAFTLSSTASLTTQNDYNVGLLLSYSYAKDPVRGKWLNKPVGQAAGGAASVDVFEDRNYNGRRDPDESGIADAKFVIDQQEIETKTDDSGHAFVTQLPAQRPTDLTVATHSLNDPRSKPDPAGYRFTPRMGKTLHLEIPVSLLGEISGTVSRRTGDGPKGKGRVEVQLVKDDGQVQRIVKTESDGYYLFGDLRPGHYRVRLAPEQLANFGLVCMLCEQAAIVDVEATSDEVKDFLLEPVSK